MCDRSPAGSDFDQADHRCQYRIALASLGRHICDCTCADFELFGNFRLAIIDHRKLCRCPADVQREKILISGTGGNECSTDHASSWSGFDHLHRLALGDIRCDDSTGGTHQVESGSDSAGFKFLFQVCNVRAHARQQDRVDHCGAGARVLAVFRADVG